MSRENSSSCKNHIFVCSLFKGAFRPGAQMCWELIRSHFGSEGHQSQEPERKGTTNTARVMNCSYSDSSYTTWYIKQGAKLQFLVFTSPWQGRTWNRSRENTSHQGEKYLTYKRRCIVSHSREQLTPLMVCACACWLVCVSVFVCPASVCVGLLLHLFAPVFLVGRGEEWDPGHE